MNDAIPSANTGDLQGARALARCLAHSVSFRAGLANYKLMPNEFLLAQVLCLETFDAGALAGRVDLDGWAERLNLRDSKGFRPDKCATLLKTLGELGMVDVNAAQATFQLRPDAAGWSRLRALRRADQAVAKGDELLLRHERLLDEALSDNSREASLRGGPELTRSALFLALRDWIASGAREQDMPPALRELTSSDKSDDTKNPVAAGFAPSSDKSDEKNPPAAAPSSDFSDELRTAGGVGGGLGASRAAAALAVFGSVPEQQQPLLPVQTAPLGPRGPGEAAVAAAALKKSQGSAKAAAAASEAWAWLQSVDYKQRLAIEEVARQWAALCERDPKYVAVRLRAKLANRDDISEPLPWLSRIARDEGRLRR